MDTRRSDWSVVGAIALIALGVWFLLGNIFGPWWQDAVRRAFHIAWPLGLIALGVLIYIASGRAGSVHQDGRRLTRSRGDRMIAGVLGGIGNYFGTDPTIVRVIYVVFTLLTGFWPGVLAYVIAMVVVPEEPPGRSSGQAPQWPDMGPATVRPASRPSSGWPHTGTETVQTPPPPPAEPEQEAPPAAEGPVQS